MAGQYQCMYCRSDISLDDVNIAKDMALCRACGKTMSFSMISGTSEISAASLNTPPRWIKVDRSFDGTTKIVYRRPSPVVLFLIPFMFIWSGGSVWGIYGKMIKEGVIDTHQALFGLPFLLGTLVLIIVILYMLFGKWVITINRTNRSGSVFMGLGGLGWTRRFSFNRESIVGLEMTNVEINHVHQKGISITTDGKKIVFGTVLAEKAKNFIAATIMQEVNYA